jgi:hypothetical protein
MTSKAHGNAKLSWDNVKVIRDMRGRKSAAQTARQFAVGKATIMDIWLNKTWRKENA